MLSDRDRRVLEEIARGTRAEDPELCERLTRPGAQDARLVDTVLDELVRTRVIVTALVGFAAALFLELPALAVTLLVVAAIGLWTRIAQTPVDPALRHGDVPPPPPPHRRPPPGRW